MSFFLAYLIFAVLSMIAAIHVYWAFGGYWPAQDRANLSSTVVGVDVAEMPSKALTLLVAFMVFLAGIVPIFWTEILPVPINRWVQAVIVSILALIFLGRGLITYTPITTKYSMVEPFVSLNRRYYSPLCLAIGAGFLIILFSWI